MFVGVCRIELRLSEARSLKEKRALVQSTTARLRRELQVAAAEVEAQEQRGLAVLGIAAVSNHAHHAQQVIDTAVRFVEALRLDAEVTAVEKEILGAL